jgi:hypothetical protein
MAEQTVPILFLLPILLIATGLFLVVGSLKRIQYTSFRNGTILFTLAFIFDVLFSVLVKENSRRAHQEELSMVLMISSGLLMLFSIIGLVYLGRNNFVPATFVNLSLFLSVFAVVVGMFYTYQLAFGEKTVTGKQSQFKEVRGGDSVLNP